MPAGRYGPQGARPLRAGDLLDRPADTLLARRITIALVQPTKQGKTELHILTNLLAEDALQVAQLYADRWTIETAFQHLTQDLRCEIDTVGYPRAALFGFCVALVAYNVVALVKGAMRVEAV